MTFAAMRILGDDTRFAFAVVDWTHDRARAAIVVPPRFGNCNYLPQATSFCGLDKDSREEAEVAADLLEYGQAVSLIEQKGLKRAVDILRAAFKEDTYHFPYPAEIRYAQYTRRASGNGRIVVYTLDDADTRTQLRSFDECLYRLGTMRPYHTPPWQRG